MGLVKASEAKIDTANAKHWFTDFFKYNTLDDDYALQLYTISLWQFVQNVLTTACPFVDGKYNVGLKTLSERFPELESLFHIIYNGRTGFCHKCGSEFASNSLNAIRKRKHLLMSLIALLWPEYTNDMDKRLDIFRQLYPGISLADAMNTLSACVDSGPIQIIDSVIKLLKAKGQEV